MKILIILVFGIILLSGCVSDDSGNIAASQSGNEIPDAATVAAECNSLCNVSAQSFCELERTVEIDGVEITGTCRAFSRNSDIGLDKCPSFCRTFDKNGTLCSVSGQTDTNCDGIAD